MCNLISNNVYFCVISFNKTQDLRFPKILEKQLLQRSPESYVSKNYINIIIHSKYIPAKCCTILCNRAQDRAITKKLRKME